MTDLDETKSAETGSDSQKGDQKRREIGGNIPYTLSIGVFERILKNMIESERPDNFSRDFLATVLNASGGAATPAIPILKKAEFLDGNGKPTQLYEQFQTNSGRANAALAGMRNAFDDIFKRNTYAHKADAEKIKEIIRTVTGLPKNDKIIGYMYNTFHAFQVYAQEASDSPSVAEERPQPQAKVVIQEAPNGAQGMGIGIGLAYNINIILPNTSNIDVYNNIFKSIKENLLNVK